MRVHLVCTIYMYAFLCLTDWFQLTKGEWAVLFVANAIVIMGELINTAVESVVDLVTEDKKPLAKRAKDTAAGAVLIGAIFAVLTGFAVLFQPQAFRLLFEYFRTHILMLIVFLISFALATVFIFLGFPGKKPKESAKDSEK